MHTTLQERIERKRRRRANLNGGIDVVGYIAGGLTITLLAWVLAFGVTWVYPIDECTGNEEHCDMLDEAKEDPCSPDNEGTDYWYEVCKDGGEM